MDNPRTFKYFESGFGDGDPSSADFGIIVNNINRPILPSIRTRETTVPGKDGTWDFGGETFDKIKISINCTILNPLDSLSSIRNIAKWLSKKKGKILISDEPDRYYYGKILDGISEEIDNAVNTGSFAIEFICDPFAYSIIDTSEEIQIGSGTIGNPDAYIVNVTGDNGSLMVLNWGTIDIKPKIFVTGDFNNISFEVNGKYISFGLAIPMVNQELIIDCSNYTVKLPNLQSQDYFYKLSGDVDDMLTLVEGVNDVIITGEELNCTVKFVFRPMFF